MASITYVGDWYATSAVLMGIGVAIFIALLLILRRDGTQQAKIPSEVEKPVDPPDSSEELGFERRRHPRRRGWPTRVRVRDAERDEEGLKAFVVDRSDGGLRVAVQSRFQVGGVIAVRADDAPQDFPWVAVLVRHNQLVGDYFELGCEFREPPTNGLMTSFG